MGRIYTAEDCSTPATPVTTPVIKAGCVDGLGFVDVVTCSTAPSPTAGTDTSSTTTSGTASTTTTTSGTGTGTDTSSTTTSGTASTITTTNGTSEFVFCFLNLFSLLLIFVCF